MLCRRFGPSKEFVNMYSRRSLISADMTLFFALCRRFQSDKKVKLIGHDLPDAVESFDQAGLSANVVDNFRRMGYVKPTEIQSYALPVLLARRDLVACAETGSGKTAAFLAPIFNHLSTDVKGMQSGDRDPCRPSALILAPTRELAKQIFGESLRIGQRCGVRSALIHGGPENYRYQLNRLKDGADVLVATPGRLNDMIRNNIVTVEQCRLLVMDEADRMLEMGFEDQIQQIIKYSRMPNCSERHTSMFSATFPPEIRALVARYMKADYAYLTIGRPGSVPSTIKQQLLWVRDSEKPDALVKLLDNDPGALTLIFVETKILANSLAQLLNENTQHKALPIHGDLTQRNRERNLEAFRAGQPPILVATSVAARGIDVPNVKQVINYTLPTNIQDYVHRVGRTGRKGNAGFAVSLCNESNAGIFKDLRDTLAQTSQEVPEFLYSTPAKQVEVKLPKKQWPRRRFNSAAAGSSARF